MYKKIKFVAAYGLQQRTFLCNKLVNSSTCQLVNLQLISSVPSQLFPAGGRSR